MQGVREEGTFRQAAGQSRSRWRTVDEACPAGLAARWEGTVNRKCTASKQSPEYPHCSLQPADSQSRKIAGRGFRRCLKLHSHFYGTGMICLQGYERGSGRWKGDNTLWCRRRRWEWWHRAWWWKKVPAGLARRHRGGPGGELAATDAVSQIHRDGQCGLGWRVWGLHEMSLSRTTEVLSAVFIRAGDRVASEAVDRAAQDHGTGGRRAGHRLPRCAADCRQVLCG